VPYIMCDNAGRGAGRRSPNRRRRDAWASFGPCGMSCWAALSAQTVVAGLRAHAGVVRRPRAVFAVGPNGLAVNSTFSQLSFRISEAFFLLFFLFICCFSFKLISLFKFLSNQ
jgi:hypothetical protein